MSILKKAVSNNHYNEWFNNPDNCVWSEPPAHQSAQHGRHCVLKREFVEIDDSMLRQDALPEMKAAILAPNTTGWEATGITRTTDMNFDENRLPRIGRCGRYHYYTGYYTRTIKYEITRDDGSTSNFSVKQLIGVRY